MAKALSSSYRMTPRQGLGAAVMGIVVSVYTSLFTGCAAVCFSSGPDTGVLRHETWIAGTVGGLAVGPAPSAGGYLLMGKGPVKSASLGTRLPLTLAPLVG